MPAHWTYDAIEEDSDLMQGDILLPNPGLRKLFEEIHPHFADEKYLAFLVVTQSCDLARRRAGGECRTRHICLAAIRSLESVLLSLLETVARGPAPGVFLNSRRKDSRDLLERVLNQNEQSYGLFYLHPDADIGLFEQSVALLRICVSFRASHYDIFLGARSGRLKPEFRDKLGWLTGNLYSRVATTDWSEQPGGRKEVNRMIDRLLEQCHEEQICSWVDDEAVEEAKANGITLEDLSPIEAASRIQEFAPLHVSEIVLDCVNKAIREVLPGLCSEEITRVSNRLRNNSVFQSTLKKARRR